MSARSIRQIHNKNRGINFWWITMNLIFSKNILEIKISIFWPPKIGQMTEIEKSRKKLLSISSKNFGPSFDQRISVVLILYIGIRRWTLENSNFFLPRPIRLKLSENLSHSIWNHYEWKFWPQAELLKVTQAKFYWKMISGLLRF